MRRPRLHAKAVLGLAVLAGTSSMTQPTEAQREPFEARHIERQGTITLDGTLEEVFALFEPRGRARWNVRWAFEFLFPKTGAGRAGAVYRQTIGHGTQNVEQVWLVTDHEPPRRIKYVIFVPGMETWELDVRLRPGASGQTIVTLDNRITSLAAEVNAEVQSFADHFETTMERWQSAITAVMKGDRP